LLRNISESKKKKKKQNLMTLKKNRGQKLVIKKVKTDSFCKEQYRRDSEKILKK
jgi:hypothetical protein